MNAAQAQPYLIVGANSVAGQSALAAIREFDPAAHTIATTSRTDALPGARETLTGIDLNQSDAAKRIIEGLGTRRPAAVFFTPSMGPVGYPAAESNPEDMQSALAFSCDPLLGLLDQWETTRFIVYSSFYWLPHISVAYGGMTAAKRRLEEIVLEHPGRVHAIRSGVFWSKSLRGISLMVRRALKTTQNPELKSLEREWKAGELGFQDFFFEFSHRTEREAFADRFPDAAHRPTTGEDLSAAALAILNGTAGPIRNVIGAWSWDDGELPELPADVDATAGAFLRDLRSVRAC